MTTKSKCNKKHNMKQDPNQIPKLKDEIPTKERRVVGATVCPHCRGKFWAPDGKRMCPWCGKHFIVTDGVHGSMVGFFSRYLEGIAVSGGISGIEVSWVNWSEKTPSDSREREGENG
jgi:hypothetical protein